MRARFLSPALLLATVAVCLSPEGALAQQNSSGDELQQLVTAEHNAVEQGDPVQILASASQLGSAALNLLGRLLTGQGLCGPAADAFAHAFQLADATSSGPTQLTTGLGLVGAAACAGQSALVESTSAALARTQGDTAQLHLMLATAHHSADDLPGTIAELNRAVAIDPNSGSAHLALGNAYWEINEYQYNPDSLREFEAAQKLSPDDAYANLMLGSILSQYHRYSDASPFLRRAASADAASPDPVLQLGANAFEENHADDADAFLRQAVALTGGDAARNGYQVRRAYAMLSRLAADRGDAPEAGKYASLESTIREQMVKNGSATPLSQSTAPTMASGLSPRSATQAAKEPAVDPKLEQTLRAIASSSLNDAGTALARQHDFAGALPFFRSAAWANPDQPLVMRNLGLAAFHAGAFREAATALDIVVRQNPDDALAREDLERSRAQIAPGQP